MKSSSSCSTSGFSSRCHAPVESESLSLICDLVPDAKVDVLSEECGGVEESPSAATRSCASTKPAGKEEDSETSDESGPLPVPKSARVVSGRRHHRLRMLVDHLM